MLIVHCLPRSGPLNFLQQGTLDATHSGLVRLESYHRDAIQRREPGMNRFVDVLSFGLAPDRTFKKFDGLFAQLGA